MAFSGLSELVTCRKWPAKSMRAHVFLACACNTHGKGVHVTDWPEPVTVTGRPTPRALRSNGQCCQRSYKNDSTTCSNLFKNVWADLLTKLCTQHLLCFTFWYVWSSLVMGAWTSVFNISSSEENKVWSSLCTTAWEVIRWHWSKPGSHRCRL